MLHRVARALRLVFVNTLCSAYWLPKRWRVWLLNRAGHRIGRVMFYSGCIVRNDRLEIGDGSFINHGAIFDDGPISLGRNTFVGQRVTFASGDHHPGTSGKRAGRNHSRPIVIGDGCWIGAHAVILAGVTVAPGCVIAAGAVVTDDTKPDGLYAGVPARRKRTLES